MDLNETLSILDVHSGAFTAIATIFLVIATVALVLATILLAHITKKMWFAQDKPWLFFYLKKLDFQIICDSPAPIFLCVKNIGKGAALDINFKVDLYNKRLPKEFKSLSPNEEIQIVELPGSADKNMASLGANVSEIRYKDLNEISKKQKDIFLK